MLLAFQSVANLAASDLDARLFANSVTGTLLADPIEVPVGSGMYTIEVPAGHASLTYSLTLRNLATGNPDLYGIGFSWQPQQGIIERTPAAVVLPHRGTGGTPSTLFSFQLVRDGGDITSGTSLTLTESNGGLIVEGWPTSPGEYHLTTALAGGGPASPYTWSGFVAVGAGLGLGFGAALQPFVDATIRFASQLGPRGPMTLRRYQETPGGTNGQVAQTVADTIVANAYRDRHTIIEIGGVRTRAEKWVLSGSQVGDDPPLNGSWKAQFSGRAEVDVIGPIGEINPDGSSVAWIVHLPQGGAA